MSGAFGAGDHRLVGVSPEIAGAGVHDVAADEEAVNPYVAVGWGKFPAPAQVGLQLLQVQRKHGPVFR